VGPLAFCAVFLLLLLFNWCFRIPYEQWAAADQRIKALEARLRPSFSVVPLVGRKPIRLGYGNTLTTLGGKRQTIMTQAPAEMLTIDVTNETARTIEACEAYLTQFSDPAATEEAFWQSLRLPWIVIGESEGGFNIPPLGTRSIITFVVVNNHVHLVNDRGVPVPMVHAIQPKGHYCGTITVTAQNAAATYVAFELICDAPEPPYLNIMRRRFGEDDAEPWAIETPIV
jgi:hypothetical protein